MNYRTILPLFSILLSLAGNAARGEVDAPGEVCLTGEHFRIVFSRDNGSILDLFEKNMAGEILHGGEDGLWKARFADGSEVHAASFSAASAQRQFRLENDSKTGSLVMSYRSEELQVTVTARPSREGVDLAAVVTPSTKTIEEFAVPARLRFNPDRLVRLVCPADGNESVGMALRGGFFKPQSQPTRWTPHSCGTKGYKSLYGSSPVMRPHPDAPVALKVTREGREWFGPGLGAQLARLQATVNRPPQPRQADVTLVDSVHGPFFSGSRLGGSGLLWRVGGPIRTPEERLATKMVAATIQRLATHDPKGRDKIGLIALHGGPAAGGWTSVGVQQWLRQLRSLPAVVDGKVHLVELKTIDQLSAAEAGNDFLAIVNPYGEWLPMAKQGDMERAVAAIGSFVRQGGNWFEVGGLSFCFELCPAGNTYEYETTYPAAFADFFHFETRGGRAAIYRAEPRAWAPWHATKDRQAVFLPGRVGCGADAKGGWCDRSTVIYATAGQTRRCPIVRLTVGSSAKDGLRAYCTANQITRRLEDKMTPELLDRFKTSVLVYLAGNCGDKLGGLALLPRPTQIHFADYLHGGFDKQYPDHLPPRPDFGTPEQFRAMVDEAHRLGHLVMPYTNPTWWCDGPKGPTFERFGEQPLLKTAEGRPVAERYALNSGFTICHWHPAVQEANRRTLRQFRDEYPADIVFQDQCGARRWHYDANPASPTPYAYTEGLLSMIDEDSRQMPLSTESGWDRVVNAESQLCGMTWAIVPTEHAPGWRQMTRDRYSPATWEIFPMAQYIAHDKAAMIHHDLGQFVTNPQVLSWTLGLGFSMSYKIHATALKQEAPRQWLLWLDRIQKSICARYVGQPLDRFEHDRGARPSAEDDGVIRSQYGSLRLVANLGPSVRKEAGLELAAYGFHATAPGLVAANVRTLGGRDFGEDGVSFITQQNAHGIDAWIYAKAEQETAILLPSPASGSIRLKFDEGSEVPTSLTGGAVTFRMPSHLGRGAQSPGSVGGGKYLWHAVVSRSQD